jgi:hypothetical protein
VKLLVSLSLILCAAILAFPQVKIGPTINVGQTVKIMGATAGGGSTLPTNNVSFWKLDEASNSTRNDSVGSNNLADTGNLAQVVGKVGNAAEFVGVTSDKLSITDNASLSFTSSFTVACWVYFDGVPTGSVFPGLISKWGAASTQKSYLLDFDGTAGQFAFGVSSDGSNQTFVNATTFGTPSTATWYFVVAYFDDTANTIGISVNNGTVDTTTFTSNVFDSTSDFELGVLAATFFFSGRLDAMGVWSRKLSAAEITELYNGAAGKEVPF